MHILAAGPAGHRRLPVGIGIVAIEKFSNIVCVYTCVLEPDGEIVLIVSLSNKFWIGSCYIKSATEYLHQMFRIVGGAWSPRISTHTGSPAIQRFQCIFRLATPYANAVYQLINGKW